jgi:hypothetical protein
MLKALAHAGAWTMATSAAVAMSWFGVHHVLADTAYDPPRALPISNAELPAPSATPSPSQSPSHSATPTPKATTAHAAPSVSPSASASPTATYTAAGTADNVHSYTTQGGRVVLGLGDSYATLVSATPADGWRMQVWTEDGWIRVTFTSSSGTSASTVYCTWNGHPPQVQTYDN